MASLCTAAACVDPITRLPAANSSSGKVHFFGKSPRSIKLVSVRTRSLAADADDEWAPKAASKKGIEDENAVGTAVEDKKEEDCKGDTENSKPPHDDTDTQGLKKALLDSLYGTDRGLKASSETRAEVNELITQLEAKNPTPAPTEALALLNGKWILVYTSFSELFPLLAAGTLPLVKVGEISQTIDSNAFTVQNSVTFTGPLATTSFSASASFEARSPKRVQIKFDGGVIGTPQLTDSIELPENVEVMGRKIDLSPIRGMLRPWQNAASSVAQTISRQPPFKFFYTRW